MRSTLPEVLPHLLDLLGDVEEEVHVFFLVAAEVMHAHVPDLTVAGDTTVALLESSRATRGCRSE